MRKLATVRKIDAIKPIDGADAIELAVCGGWQSVIKRGEYRVGDLAVYLEIDSWVPTDLAPFLSKGKEPQEYNGVKGERLRTVKLRGALSQGLLLQGVACPTGLMLKQHNSAMQHIFQEGDDVSEWLDVQKWERPIPTQLAGNVRGDFPSLIPKTDQERAQNLTAEIAEACALGALFEVTEKLEGSSCTFYLDKEGDFHACSRNLSMYRDEANSFWRAAIKYDVEAIMIANKLHGFAVQGELIGPGIQGNIYGLKDVEFKVFDVYSEHLGRYLSPVERRDFIKLTGFIHTPILHLDKDLGTGSVADLLDMSSGASSLNPKVLREGLVWKEMNGGMTFKTVSNQYLLKSGG